MTPAPTTFAEWQTYPLALDPIHVAWLKQAKKASTAFAVADIEGVEISHKRFLTGVLLFAKKIKQYSPEQNVALMLLLLLVVLLLLLVMLLVLLVMLLLLLVIHIYDALALCNSYGAWT